MGDAGTGQRIRANSRRRVLIVAALAVLVAGVVWNWVRLRKAVRQVDWLRRHINLRTAAPFRRRSRPGKNGIVVSSIRVASDISPEGRPLHCTSALPAKSRAVYIFFDYSGARKGDTLTTDWFLDGRYQHVTTVPVELPPDEGHGQLQLKLDEGEALPAGHYRVDLIVNDTVVGSVEFTVERAERHR